MYSRKQGDKKKAASKSKKQPPKPFSIEGTMHMGTPQKPSGMKGMKGRGPADCPAGGPKRMQKRMRKGG